MFCRPSLSHTPSSQSKMPFNQTKTKTTTALTTQTQPPLAPSSRSPLFFFLVVVAAGILVTVVVTKLTLCVKLDLELTLPVLMLPLLPLLVESGNVIPLLNTTSVLLPITVVLPLTPEPSALNSESGTVVGALKTSSGFPEIVVSTPGKTFERSADGVAGTRR